MLSGMDSAMLQLRTDLDRARGYWPRIATDTGVDHSTIARIARGEIENPRIDTFGKIREWIDVHPYFLADAAPPAQSGQPA